MIIPKILSDALTNLFVGIFAGTVLLCVQKIPPISQVSNDISSQLLLLSSFIYLIYLSFGYFNLFISYHSDGPYFACKQENGIYRKNRLKYLILASILFTYSIAPYLINSESIKWFYALLIIVFILDIVWTKLYISSFENKVMESNFYRRYISNLENGINFDILGLIPSCILFVILNNIDITKITYDSSWSISIWSLHLVYIAAFISYYRQDKTRH